MTTEPEKPETLNADEWMSKGDAARARGVSRQAIWELVNRGRLTTCRFKGRVYVSRAEVMAFKRRPRGPNGTGYVKGKAVRLKKKKLDPTKWIYLVEAARMTGLPRLAIVDLIRRGRMRKVVSGSKTFVSRAGIEDFMRQQRTPEPKSKPAKKK
ncbi:MAG: helix-turn-helix domain-containing protein [Candidatus Angelobacter sp.]